MVWIGCRVVRLRCARELEDFLDDAVHVKHERHTAVADECEPQFLFFHERTPRGNLASLLSSNELGMRSIGNRILQWRAGLAVASRRVRRERAGAQLFTAPRASMPLPATEFRAGRRSDKGYGTSRHFAILQTGWREDAKPGVGLAGGQCVNEWWELRPGGRALGVRRRCSRRHLRWERNSKRKCRGKCCRLPCGQHDRRRWEHSRSDFVTP